MTNKKITDLVSTTTLDLTEFIPVVQGGATKKILLSDLMMSAPMKELAYAENASGTVIAVGASDTDVTGCVINVPASTKPIWLEGYGTLDLTAPPAASNATQASLFIKDELDNYLAFANQSFEGANGTYPQVTVLCRARIAASPIAKTYRLGMAKNNSTGLFNIMNGSISPVFKSYIAAFGA